MNCSYCAYSGGGHDVACPESKSGDAKIQAHKIWDAGYRAGRSGSHQPTDASATYSLGHGRGVVSLEEAENGYDPRFDDPVDLSPDELWDEHDDRIDEYMDTEYGD